MIDEARTGLPRDDEPVKKTPLDIGGDPAGR